MTEPEHVRVALQELDCIDDPRGGAAAWALLVVGMTLVVGVLAVIGAAGAAW